MVVIQVYNTASDSSMSDIKLTSILVNLSKSIVFLC